MSSPTASRPAVEISLPLVLDGQYLGDIAVKIQGERVEIGTERVLQLLRPYIAETSVGRIEKALSTQTVDLDKISIEGLSFRYDQQLLQIEVETNMDARLPRRISLRKNSNLNDINILEPADFSFFVTPTARLTYDWEDGLSRPKGFQPVSGQVDFGGRIGQEKGIALTTRLKYQGGKNGYVARTESRAIYDILPKFMRVTAGDLYTRGESFQFGPAIAGISIERFFDFDSRRVIRPVGRSLFDLDRPSTLEVYNNGVLRYRQNLESGRYDINDLPLVQGSNAVEIRITDDIGQETVLSDKNFFDFGLLQRGLSDFSLSAGVKSRPGIRNITYSDEPVFSGFYRRGLTDRFTGSLNLQADRDGANAGLTGLMATPLGSVFVEGAVSRYKSRDTGFALGALYRLNKSFGRKNWALNLTSKYKSAAFAQVQPLSNTTPFSGQTTRYDSLELGADSRLSGEKWSGSIFLNYQDIGDREQYSAGLGGSYRISSDLSLSLFAQHTDGQRKEQRITAQLGWRIGPQISARGQYDSGQNRAQISYNKSAAQYVGSLSYGLGATYDFDTGQNDVFGDAVYTGNRFVASARHATGFHDGFKAADNTSRLNLSSSLVFADGRFALARPVRENFVIVNPHDSIADKQVILDPTRNGFGAKSDFFGPAIMTQMTPFDSRVTYIDVDDLPVGYDIGSSGFTTKPYLHSGYKFRVGTDASYSVIGQVVDGETGEPVRYLGGRFESLDNPDTDPVPAFTNRNGRLAATGLTPGRHRLTLLSTPEFTMEIEIPETDEALIRLGDIRLGER